MRRGPISIIDRSAASLRSDGSFPDDAGEPGRASWYTPGFSDGLGDRLLMFDNTTASSLELLRFKKEFGNHPAFEPALRRRLEQLAAFNHPGVANIRAVKWLGDDDGLALVSNYVAGRRLSELLHEPRGSVLTLELIRQVIPILALLERHGDGVAHGALTADRIVVTPDGRLVLVEHVLGPALAALGLSAGRIRVDMGLAVLPDHDGISIGGKADVVQLALIAVSLVLGRRVNPAEYPESCAVLLDELRDARPGGQPAPPPLRIWLMRALQGGDEAFQSAAEAHEALAELLDGTDARLSERPQPLAFPRPVDTNERARPRSTVAAPAQVRPALAAPAASAMGEDAEPAPQASVLEWAPSRQARRDERPPAPASLDAPLTPKPLAPPATSRGRIARAAQWAAAVLALVAVGQAVFIARLITKRDAGPAPTAAAAPPIVAAPPAPSPSPSQPPAAVPADTARVTPPKPEASAPPVQRPTTESKPPVSTPPGPALIGGVRIVSPIELKAFEDGVLVGSTAGAMAVSAGAHTFDLVNDAVGYRARQVVQVKGGVTTALTVSPPNGRLSINATPWAEVFIDGKLVGETPLANLSVPLGEHQILFRHPQFGEQRQTALVKVDAPARVSVTFQR